MIVLLQRSRAYSESYVNSSIDYSRLHIPPREDGIKSKLNAVTEEKEKTNNSSSDSNNQLSSLENSVGTSKMDVPSMLEKWNSNMFNKNGRIGIYTREERSVIIRRFLEKRAKRVWKKKIRFCFEKNYV